MPTRPSFLRNFQCILSPEEHRDFSKIVSHLAYRDAVMIAGPPLAMAYVQPAFRKQVHHAKT